MSKSKEYGKVLSKICDKAKKDKLTCVYLTGEITEKGDDVTASVSSQVMGKPINITVMLLSAMQNDSEFAEFIKQALNMYEIYEEENKPKI